VNRVRLAVVGVGYLGRIHARLAAAADPLELVAVVDPSAATRHEVAVALGVDGFADVRDVLEQIDAAVVAAPTPRHHAIGTELLAAGKHVLMEKPLATSGVQCEELVELAEHHGLVLQVGHIERFNPALQAALPGIEAPVRFLEARRCGPFAFRSTDVGVVMDLMIHDLDIALALAGSRPVAVEAVGRSLVTRHEDMAHACVRFENGCLAALTASRVSPQAERRMQVWTDVGVHEVDFAGCRGQSLRQGPLLRRGEFDVDLVEPAEVSRLKDSFFAEVLPLESFEAPRGNAIEAELLDFAESIRQGRSPRVDGRQGARAVSLAQEILAVIQTQRATKPAAHQTSSGVILQGPHWPQTTAAPRRAAG